MARSHWIQHALSWSALTLVALIAYFQARAATEWIAGSLPHAVEPPQAKAARTALLRPRPSAAAILARNAFDSITGPLARNTSAGGVPPLARHDVDPLFAPTCSEPRVVIVSEATDPRWSMAAFRATGETRAELHRIGEQVMGQRIEFIGFNPVERSPAVWLSTPGELCQALLFPHGSSAARPESGVAQIAEASTSATPLSNATRTVASKIRKLSDTEFEIERSAIDQIMDNQLELTKNVRLVPESKDGKVVGIRLFGIRPGSLPALLGLENGDLLQSINGFSMASPESALSAYAQLPRASLLDVRLERRGAPLSLSIHIR